MRISKEEVEKLAHLARLEFSDDEKLRMQADMDKILGFVDKINELDLAGVEPLVYLNEDRNVMRTDK
ncbi:MAG: aspartyl-tRNA(Asn)/glutamyl-tRNA(Gln) amidotransferase subunit C, partial [Roseivirga sp.]